MKKIFPNLARPLTDVIITNRNLQKLFQKHGDDFGLAGNWNPGRADDVRQAILGHVNCPNSHRIPGVYRGEKAIHVLNLETRLNVTLDSSGRYIGGWKLSEEQLKSVLATGRLF